MNSDRYQVVIGVLDANIIHIQRYSTMYRLTRDHSTSKAWTLHSPHGPPVLIVAEDNFPGAIAKALSHLGLVTYVVG